MVRHANRSVDFRERTLVPLGVAMAGRYKNDLSTIIAGATRNRYPKAELVCKHFFSGAALYVNGHICVSLTPVGLAVKLPEGDRVRLRTKHLAKPLRYFANGPIKKEYVVLPEDIMRNTRTLNRWIRVGIEYVLKSNVKFVQK